MPVHSELPPALEASNRRLLSQMRAGAYDFIDIGSWQGAGLGVGHAMGGTRGLGFELDQAAVTATLGRGADVICMDVKHVPSDIPKVRFAICRHVLEHLDTLYDVGAVVARLSRMCADFLYISGPLFDTEEALYRHGLKVVHSAMTGHTCRFKSIDMIKMLFDLDLREFTMGVSVPMTGSADPWIHPAGSPNDVWTWDASQHPPKPHVTFSPPLYRDMVFVVALRPGIDAEAIMRTDGLDKVVLRSSHLL